MGTLSKVCMGSYIRLPMSNGWRGCVSWQKNHKKLLQPAGLGAAKRKTQTWVFNYDSNNAHKAENTMNWTTLSRPQCDLSVN